MTTLRLSKVNQLLMSRPVNRQAAFVTGLGPQPERSWLDRQEEPPPKPATMAPLPPPEPVTVTFGRHPQTMVATEVPDRLWLRQRVKELNREMNQMTKGPKRSKLGLMVQEYQRQLAATR